MTEFSGKTIETSRYNYDELIRLFGDNMPMEAVEVLFNSPGELTLGEVREKVAEIAKRWNKGRYKTAQEVIVDYLKVLNSMANQIDLRFVDMARILIERLHDHGFVVVPKIATDTIKRAYDECLPDCEASEEAGIVWRGMIEAAIQEQIKQKTI